MSRTVRELPEPSKTHATCAWCATRLDTIVALLEHVDAERLAAAAA